jgi:hypothetical protein
MPALSVRCSRRTANQISYLAALLLISVFGLTGCSGLVSSSSTNAMPTSLIISNVQASAPTATGFQVSWSTNLAANSTIDYGTSASYGSSTPVNGTMVTSHQQALAGLTAGTLYHFRVRSTDANNDSAASGDMTFATLALSGPIISGVSTNSITSSGAVITWTTDVQATSQVEYGTTTAYGTLTTLDGTLVTSHTALIGGLNAGTLYHYRAHSKNANGVETISGDFMFQTNTTVDTIPPTVSITSPANGATVAGSVVVSAAASDNVGVTSVQIQLDGVNFGSALTAAPYSVTWNTTTVGNGTHTLGASARDAAGNVGNAITVSVTVSNTSSTASQDFQNRCTATGVIACQGFDNASVFAIVNSGTGLYAGDGSSPGASATQDCTIAASGCSLKFTIPGKGGSNPAGYWWEILSQRFSQNSTFYVQFRQRFSPEYISNVWPQSGGGVTYWKQHIFAQNPNTCINVQLVTVNNNNGGFPQMYSQCGADNFWNTLGGGDYLLEQGDTAITGYNCHYRLVNTTDCFFYPSNTWVTFYYQVNVGTFGSPNSTIKASVAVGGGPYVEWINMPNHTIQQDTGPTDGFDLVTLTPYWTGRDANVSAGPTAYTWYDELIVSSKPIAAPNN